MPTIAGVDIGGTFTDAVLVDGGGRLTVAKAHSTPADMAQGFLATLDLLAARSGVPASDLTLLAHGTTVATNAIVQGRVARTGLITTRGFRDVLEIGTQMRDDVYDLQAPLAPPLVPRPLRLEVRERVGPDGAILEPLDHDDVARAADELAAAGVEAVAICFLFSFANPEHERTAAAIVAERTRLPVTTSEAIAAEIREYPRMATTAVNASLLPLVGGYVGRLGAQLADASATAPLSLMCSNGGLARADTAAQAPIRLIASGPAAGAIGAGRLASLAGLPDALSLDVGGTTADVAAIHGGRPALRYRGEVAGHPIALPQVDVGSIGAGGGSIARVDAYGALTVGPESAGAVPGPAAYGAGGEDATVTDAHVVLGTLDPDAFLGGRVPLDRAAAERAVTHHVARPLRCSAEAAALAIVRVVCANMAAALRLVSVARGEDPRRHVLVGLGGAGPLHACAIADELDMTRVLVPRHPGVTAALGLLLTDERHDLARSFVRRTSAIRGPELSRLARDLGRAATDLLSGPGRTAFALDMRYRGQAFELAVQLPEPTLGGLERAVESFHRAHRRAYGHASPGAETEVVAVRATAVRPARRIRWAAGDQGSSRSSGVVTIATTRGRRRHRTYERSGIGADAIVRGPALITQEDSTTLVPAGWTARPVAGGSLLVERA